MESLILSSLANHTRLKLLICLSESEKNVTQLIGNCGLSQSAVSQHLEKLRNAGLVTTKKIGKEVYYSLTHSKTGSLSKKILSFIEEVQK
ncbi:MAG: metalloregulator ArsR/SmtB family transcription factor [Candidatus Levybacteria bacterium]|nr:metalloregulator ArsR/SmtB family transcription factor [Candidatus Levybacteria bacterium]